jgi:transposase-like protein
MRTKDKERRAYPKEFKAEAVAPAGKRQNPVRQVSADLGINENMLHRWILKAREAGAQAYRPFPGTDSRGTRNLPACGRKSRRCGRQCEAGLHLRS